MKKITLIANTLLSLVVFHWEMRNPWQLLPSTPVYFLTAWEEIAKIQALLGIKALWNLLPTVDMKVESHPNPPINADACVSPQTGYPLWLGFSPVSDLTVWHGDHFLADSSELVEGDLKVLQTVVWTSTDRLLVFNLSFLIGVST